MKQLICIIFSLALVFTTYIACAAGFCSDPTAIENAIQSVLMLEIYDKDNNMIATGSGFVMFDNMTVVTNYHVITDACMIIADSDDGYQYFITKVLIADEAKDIAILQFMTPTIMTPLVPSTQKPKRGESVVAIGSPIGLKNTVSIGNISSIYIEDDVDWIQFTAAISHGSSGGALFNDSGEVIGITSAYLEGGQNLNLAINIVEATNLYNKWAGIKYDISDYKNANIHAVKPTSTPAPTVTPTPTTKPTIKPTVTPKPTIQAVTVTFKQTDSVYHIRVKEKLRIPSIIHISPLNASLETIWWSCSIATDNWKISNYDSISVENLKEVTITQSSSSSGTKPKCIISNGYISFTKPGVYVLYAAAPNTFYVDSCIIVVEPEDGVMMYFEPGNAYSSWEYAANNRLSIRFQVTNSIMSQTVKAFEIYVYATDVWGNELYNNSVYYMTTTKTVYPGKTVYTDNILIPQANSIKKVYCGIHKVLFEDGSVATAKTVDYTSWEIKK